MATTATTRGSRRASSNGNGNGSRTLSPEIRPPRKAREVQPFGHIRMQPIALSAEARMESCRRLAEIQADSQVLYGLYKKSHWTVAGPTFYPLHLLFDKHAEEQLELVDLLAERIQSLGGIAVGDPRQAAELTCIERAPDGAEEVTGIIARLLDAHEAVLERIREAIPVTEELEDWGSNDLLMGDVLRRHELQVWFVSAHLVDIPLAAPKR